MTEAQKKLIANLAEDAKRHERQAKEAGYTKKAEYFRGVAAAFKCTIKVLED